MMSETNDLIALFDLDNTLADYQGAMERDLALISSPDEKPWTFEDGDPPAHIEHRMSLIKMQPGWWRQLAPMDDGFKLLQMANDIGFKPHILTKGPFKTTAAWEEKVLWVRLQIDHPIDITITQDKGLVYGRILVDDWPPYATRWLEHRPRGLVVMPKRSYNKDFRHPQIVLFDGTPASTTEVFQRMRAAADR